MSQKTLDKLKAICQPHGVEVEATELGYAEWSVTFHAPARMCWGSSQATVVCWDNSLRGIIGFIKSELQCGFYEADDETLRITGQAEGDPKP